MLVISPASRNVFDAGGCQLRTSVGPALSRASQQPGYLNVFEELQVEDHVPSEGIGDRLSLFHIQEDWAVVHMFGLPHLSALFLNLDLADLLGDLVVLVSGAAE